MLEILIALGLISILLTLLFSFMAQQLKVEKRMEVARAHVLERQNLQLRMQDLFTSLHANIRQSFYTDRFAKEKYLSIVFVFDHGIDTDPQFSGTLIGRIYLDGQQNLCLAMWPIEEGKKERSWRQEILLPHVSDLSFQFLGEKGNGDPRIQSITPEVAWHPDWPQQRDCLPSVVRLKLQQEGATLGFAFRIPTAWPIATYYEEGT